MFIIIIIILSCNFGPPGNFIPEEPLRLFLFSSNLHSTDKLIIFFHSRVI